MEFVYEDTVWIIQDTDNNVCGVFSNVFLAKEFAKSRPHALYIEYKMSEWKITRNAKEIPRFAERVGQISSGD